MPHHATRHTPMPLISVIIPARNEEQSIAESIHSILSQTYSRKEVIVVNDGSTDQTAAIVRKMAQAHHGITLLNFRQGHSAAFARNQGAKEARGDILVFHDADCTAEKHYLQHIVGHFVKHNVDGVSNKTLATSSTSFIAKCIAAQRSMLWDTNQITPTPYTNHTPTLIASFRKKVFHALGGYNERIFYFEDTDLSQRFVDHGFKAVYQPDAIEYHQDPHSISELIRQARWFGKGIAYNFKERKEWKPFLSPLYAILTLGVLTTAILSHAIDSTIAPAATLAAVLFVTPLIAYAIRMVVASKDIVHSLGFLPIFLLRNSIKFAYAVSAVSKRELR